VSRWPGAAGEGWPSWAFENHDAPRAVSRWAAATHRDAFARAKMVLLAGLRGNIFLYQGEELGLTQVAVPFEKLQDPEAIANWPLTLGRDGVRTPMPWLPFGADHGAMAVEVQEGDAASLLHWTRQVLALRRALPALRLGTMRFVTAPAGVIAFERVHDGERLLVAVNLTDVPVAWARGGEWMPVLEHEVGDDGFAAYGALIARWGA
jgi:alpha-glucosidase